MTAVFLKILNMSITGAIVAAAVILLRLLLKRAPRAIICALWVLVALRLVIPFTFESEMSLMPTHETVSESSDGSVSVNTGISFINSALSSKPIPQQNITPPVTAPDSGSVGNDAVTLPDAGDTATVESSASVADIAAAVWVVGACLMVLYAAVSYLRIKLKVRENIVYEKNIRICDRIASPFILGIIKPKIYLPSSTPEGDTTYIISHEKAHLKRLDHLWKPLGFLLLSLHWFNPIMWIAYILLCRDIELACDEKVIRQMGESAKKPYSDALISASSPRRLISACPLAFGEVGVKRRIKAVLSYKKPTLWIIIAALLAVCVIAVCFLTDPKDNEEAEAPFCITAQSSSCDMDGVWAEITKTDTAEGTMTVVWHNDTEKELTFGEEFYIYRVEENGNTVDTYTFADEYAWHLVGYPVTPGGTFEKEYNLTHHEILKDEAHLYKTYFSISGDNPVPDGLKKYTLSVEFVTSESFPITSKPAESDTPDLPMPALSSIENAALLDNFACVISLDGYNNIIVKNDDAKEIYNALAEHSKVMEVVNPPSSDNSIHTISLCFAASDNISEEEPYPEEAYYCGAFHVHDNDTVTFNASPYMSFMETYNYPAGTYEKVKAMVEGYTVGIPSEYHLGTWAASNHESYETLTVNSVSNKAVSFNVTVAKFSHIFILEATAHEKDGKFYFGEDVSTQFNAPEGVSGYLEFAHDSISITFDSFGIMEGQIPYDKTYEYTMKLAEEADHYYCYGTKEVLHPSLTLFRDSKTFTFTYSYLSSYAPHGTYELTEDTLTLNTYDGLYTYVFDVEGDSFIFDEARSSPLPKYKYSSDAEEALPPFEDGAKFESVKITE